MSDSTQGAPEGLVLLDEWHVQVFVPAGVSAAACQVVREVVATELRSVALRTEAHLESMVASLRIEVES